MSETLTAKLRDLARQSIAHENRWASQELLAAADRLDTLEQEIAGRPVLKTEWQQLESSLAACQRELAEARDALNRFGFRRCDIPACNCNGWHGGHSAARLTEIGDALEAADISLNGSTILQGVATAIEQRDALKLRAEAAEAERDTLFF